MFFSGLQNTLQTFRNSADAKIKDKESIINMHRVSFKRIFH